MAVDTKNLKVIIVEEQLVLLSYMSNMLKNMGFAEGNVHKATNFITFNRLVKNHTYHLIICNYLSKGRVVGTKYKHLYQQCSCFSSDCAFVFVTGKLEEAERLQIEAMAPDAIIETPFNYNQLKDVVDESLRKRQAFTTISHHLAQGNMAHAKLVCDRLSKKNPEWRIDLNKAIIDYYLNQDKTSAAFQILDALHLEHPSEWVLLKMIELHSQMGSKDTALELAHEYEVMGYPEHHLISEITAFNSILDSNIDQALGILEQITMRYPHLVEAAINFAYLLVASNDHGNAYSSLRRVDPNFIANDEQLFCVEELRFALEVVHEIKHGNPVSNKRLMTKMNRFLDSQTNQEDDLTISKQLYKTVAEIISGNPVCSMNRLLKIWEGTRLPHRKILVVALACYMGFIDEVSEWVERESDGLKKLNNIDAAVVLTVYQKLDELKQDKQSRIALATQLESKGQMVEPLAIRSHEMPSLITHHLDFVNGMIKYQLNDSQNLNMLWSQFKKSASILITNLEKQDPSHPKVKVIEKMQRKVQIKVHSAMNPK